MRAALVLVRPTNSEGVSRPVPTPWCHSTLIRSSMPPVPLGMLRKSSRPIRFCSVVNTQWSVPITEMVPSAMPFQSAS